MENNKYLEEFKIDVVKQYLGGRQKKEICKVSVKDYQVTNWKIKKDSFFLEIF